MKTSITKKAVTATISEARALEAKAREARLEARRMKVKIHEEEETILRDMATTVQQAGGFMTAREIVNAIGGTMSVHEVAGQLSFARSSRNSQRPPMPYFCGGAKYDMKHTAMQEAAPAVEVEERHVTRKFVEVDESGKIIPGGRTFKQREIRNIYAIKK